MPRHDPTRLAFACSHILLPFWQLDQSSGKLSICFGTNELHCNSMDMQ